MICAHPCRISHTYDSIDIVAKFSEVMINDCIVKEVDLVLRYSISSFFIKKILNSTLLNSVTSDKRLRLAEQGWICLASAPTWFFLVLKVKNKNKVLTFKIKVMKYVNTKIWGPFDSFEKLNRKDSVHFWHGKLNLKIRISLHLTLKTKKNQRSKLNYFTHTKLELRPSLFIPELNYVTLAFGKTW